MSAAIWNEPPRLIPPRMTFRVSRDSGRTWEPTREVFALDCEVLMSSVWPPCQCPIHQETDPGNRDPRKPR